jgi:cytochrome c556
VILEKLKRRPVIVVLHLVLFAFIANIIYSHTDLINAVKIPPSALSQWYKPENKRQVWLHNMFKLRREMQAVEFYAQNKDPELLAKWSAKLNEHYLKIGKMVPEWKGKLSSQILAELNEQVEQNQFNDIPKTLKDLSLNCQSCHTDYQKQTAVLYRAPDFSNIILPSKTDSAIPYTQHMDSLSKQVNQIKIASEDGMKGLALSSLAELKQGMHTLGQTCSNCHKSEIEAYPSKAMTQSLAQLEQSLQTGSLKDQGRSLGTLAVQACARCHGTHRMSYDARKQLSDKMDWGQLITH